MNPKFKSAENYTVYLNIHIPQARTDLIAEAVNNQFDVECVGPCEYAIEANILACGETDAKNLAYRYVKSDLENSRFKTYEFVDVHVTGGGE